MRKKLGVLASVLLLSASALLWSGCQDRCCDTAPVCVQSQPACPAPARPSCPPVCKPACAPAPVCQPVCPPARPACAPAPVCQPVCAPAPACKPVPACAPAPACQPVCPPPCEPLCKLPAKCKFQPTAELTCLDGITVVARNPSRVCMLGEQYPIEFDIKACDDVCDVVVTARLPEGVSFVRSMPEANVRERTLVWNIGHMDKCQVINAKVFVKCECEGEQCVCFCATATPVRFCSLVCAKPRLTCEKCGPEQVCPGDPMNYTITVTNRGSCTAEEVVVTDSLPDGVQHSSGQRQLIFKLGSLEPCQTKTVNFCVTAVKRGKVTNNIVVTACNADSTSCQWTTCICCCGIECTKIGPKEMGMGKNADYQITVTNTGDLPLTDVVVTDTAPSATSIVAANGAQVNGNHAVWRLREMKPGEKASFSVTLTTCTPGCFTNRVNVTNCQGCTAACEYTTRWKGRPSINACITETESPICIGETTSYNINVVNQGSEADTNVVITVRFPAEVTPVGVTGDVPGKIEGQTVTFAPIANFNARQNLKLRVDGRAKSSGDARIILDVTSDSMKTPLTQQESTIVN